jgi:heme-degrading monooxygenase HmoA
MSVLMTLRVKGDAKKLEALYAADKNHFARVADKGKTMGATYHRFYATDDEVLVVDQWPDEESFHAFFSSTPEIPEIMAAAGVTEQPTVTFWHELDLGDSIG